MLVPMSGLAGARPGSGRLGVFPFRFDRVARCLLVPLGVTPATSGVQVTRGRVLIRYGPWRATIDRSDIRAVRAAGPFKAWKAIGPRVSLADRGLTLGTSTRSAVCIELRQPIGVLMPRRLLAHPAVTVTVDRPGELVRLLRPGPMSLLRKVADQMAQGARTRS
jgi:hypothetical protein